MRNKNTGDKSKGEPIAKPRNPAEGAAVTDYEIEKANKGEVPFDKPDWAEDIPDPKDPEKGKKK